MAVEITGKKKNILSSVINLDVSTCYFTHFLVARRLSFPLIFVERFPEPQCSSGSCEVHKRIPQISPASGNYEINHSHKQMYVLIWKLKNIRKKILKKRKIRKRKGVLNYLKSIGKYKKSNSDLQCHFDFKYSTLQWLSKMCNKSRLLLINGNEIIKLTWYLSVDVIKTEIN